jgi:hypothetical protein
MPDEKGPTPQLNRRTVLGGIATLGAAAALPVLTPGTAAAATAVDFHPGHYYWPSTSYWTPENQDAHFRSLDALSDNPYIKGIKVGFHWKYFETDDGGDYTPGFTIIKAYLDKLRSLKTRKHLILHINERTYNYSGSAYPQYLIDNGSVVYAPSGTYWSGRLSSAAKIWEKPVMDRLIAMTKAIAGKFNTDDRFEMLSLGESTHGALVPNNIPFQDYYNQLVRWFTENKAVWTRTILRLNANYIRNQGWMRNLITTVVNAPQAGGIGVGGPDPELPLPTPSRLIEANQVFRGLDGGTDLRGAVPWVGEVQAMGLGVKYTQTPKEIFDYYYNVMHVTHMIWLQNVNQGVGDVDQQWSTGILPYINSIQGRIHTAFPTIGTWETT